MWIHIDVPDSTVALLFDAVTRRAGSVGGDPDIEEPDTDTDPGAKERSDTPANDDA
ncbi:MAG: hypothetical protein ABEJ73_07060 [Haloplanus sp.]